MKFSWTFWTIVFHENALENVFQKMAAIVSQPQRARLIYGNKKRLVFGADYAYIFSVNYRDTSRPLCISLRQLGQWHITILHNFFIKSRDADGCARHYMNIMSVMYEDIPRQHFLYKIHFSENVCSLSIWEIYSIIQHNLPINMTYPEYVDNDVVRVWAQRCIEPIWQAQLKTCTWYFYIRNVIRLL